jgi:hypothetical protein
MTTLYKKVGRKYVPHRESFLDSELTIPVGSFVMAYAYTGGGKKYSYEVKPDTAGFVAAAMIAQHSIVEAINEKNRYRPDAAKSTPYTKEQRALVEEFSEKMRATGALLPDWWTTNASYEIADAAIDAVRNYKP